MAAIEHLDRRSLDLVREDGADRRHQVTIPGETGVALLAELEIRDGRAPTRGEAYDQIAAALQSDAPDTALVRICRLLDETGLLDRVEIVLPDERARRRQLLAVREAVPEGVNRRIAAARRRDPRIGKTAADVIVPFSRVQECIALLRSALEREALDHAIWGHISDGNVHPNVIPTCLDDVVRGEAALLACGRRIIEMGGCPMAEHGVGRNRVKQTLLRDLYGERGIDQMRRVKAALDPDGRLAPGVIFPSAR